MNLTRMQKEILRAIELHGGIGAEMGSKHGWLTRGGLPVTEFRQLIDPPHMGGLYLVAPRVATSQPLKVVWQLRNTATHQATLAKIASEMGRLGYKEHAPGGLELKPRKDLNRYQAPKA